MWFIEELSHDLLLIIKVWNFKYMKNDGDVRETNAEPH